MLHKSTSISSQMIILIYLVWYVLTDEQNVCPQFLYHMNSGAIKIPNNFFTNFTGNGIWITSVEDSLIKITGKMVNKSYQSIGGASTITSQPVFNWAGGNCITARNATKIEVGLVSRNLSGALLWEKRFEYSQFPPGFIFLDEYFSPRASPDSGTHHLLVSNSSTRKTELYISNLSEITRSISIPQILDASLAAVAQFERLDATLHFLILGLNSGFSNCLFYTTFSMTSDSDYSSQPITSVLLQVSLTYGIKELVWVEKNRFLAIASDIKARSNMIDVYDIWPNNRAALSLRYFSQTQNFKGMICAKIEVLLVDFDQNRIFSWNIKRRDPQNSYVEYPIRKYNLTKILSAECTADNTLVVLASSETLGQRILIFRLISFTDPRRWVHSVNRVYEETQIQGFITIPSRHYQGSPDPDASLFVGLLPRTPSSKDINDFIFYDVYLTGPHAEIEIKAKTEKESIEFNYILSTLIENTVIQETLPSSIFLFSPEFPFSLTSQVPEKDKPEIEKGTYPLSKFMQITGPVFSYETSAPEHISVSPPFEIDTSILDTQISVIDSAISNAYFLCILPEEPNQVKIFNMLSKDYNTSLLPPPENCVPHELKSLGRNMFLFDLSQTFFYFLCDDTNTTMKTQSIIFVYKAGGTVIWHDRYFFGRGGIDKVHLEPIGVQNQIVRLAMVAVCSEEEPEVVLAYFEVDGMQVRRTFLSTSTIPSDGPLGAMFEVAVVDKFLVLFVAGRYMNYITSMSFLCNETKILVMDSQPNIPMPNTDEYHEKSHLACINPKSFNQEPQTPNSQLQAPQIKCVVTGDRLESYYFTYDVLFPGKPGLGPILSNYQSIGFANFPGTKPIYVELDEELVLVSIVNENIISGMAPVYGFKNWIAIYSISDLSSPLKILVGNSEKNFKPSIQYTDEKSGSNKRIFPGAPVFPSTSLTLLLADPALITVSDPSQLDKNTEIRFLSALTNKTLVTTVSDCFSYPATFRSHSYWWLWGLVAVGLILIVFCVVNIRGKHKEDSQNIILSKTPSSLEGYSKMNTMEGEYNDLTKSIRFKQDLKKEEM